MDLGLDGKVAVVTAASGGIGLAVTQALVAEGAQVVAGSRTTENLEGVDGVTAVALDLMEPDAPAQLVARAIEEHGRVDVLLNNLGAAQMHLDGFLATTDEDFQWAFEINFMTALRASRAALADMVEHGSGAVVNVASVNSFYHPDSVVAAYGAAKAAMVNLTKALSQEFGPKGIRINAVSPGPVATDFWLGPNGVAATIGARMGVDADTARERIVEGMGGIPSGRFTTPEEVATLVVMLASGRTSNVTGANFVIDGGLIKTT
jgi:NAD(P)-dependent dehydrogenase (short-subunit alcohol dehydrogenase family)